MRVKKKDLNLPIPTGCVTGGALRWTMIKLPSRVWTVMIFAMASVHCVDDGGDVTGQNVTVLEVSAGYRRSCALDIQGVVWCWGKDSEYGGALNTLDPIPSKEPAFSTGKFSHVRVRMDDACAISSTGDLLCAYIGNVKTLSANVMDFDQAVGSDEKPRSATPIGRDCLLRTDGTTFCGLTEEEIREEVIVPSRAIAVGSDHACTLGVDSVVRCWGKGILGDGVDRRSEAQAGAAVPDPVLASAPVVLSELGTDVADIKAGGYTTCVLKADRSVWCWGPWRGDNVEHREPALSPKPMCRTLSTTESRSCIPSRSSVCRQSVLDPWRSVRIMLVASQ